MKQIQIRRNKIAKELSRQQKQKYFQQRRSQLLSALEVQTTQDQNQSIKWLRLMIHRSLINNQLLSEIRFSNLLEQMESRIKESSSVRELQLILVLGSNILIDQISLDEKQRIVSLCLYTFSLPLIRKQLVSQNRNITFMLSITHIIISMFQAAKFIDEYMAIQCESTTLPMLLMLLQSLVQIIMTEGESFHKERQYQIAQNICQSIVKSLILFLSYEQEYVDQINMKFNRNIGTFKQILDTHFKLMNGCHNKCYLDQIIHQGLLIMYAIVSEKVSTVNFPMFFSDKALFNLIIHQIIQNRSTNLNTITINILLNITADYSQSNSVDDVSAEIQNAIINKEEIFFRNLLLKDKSQRERLRLIKEIMNNKQLFNIFQKIFLQNWKEVIDNCCYLLNQSSTSHSQRKQSLQILILCCDKNLKDYTPILYLRYLGVDFLLKNVQDKYFDEEEDCQIENQINEYCCYLQQLMS